jgi:hypothetical protein
MLYRWHSTASQADEVWTEKLFNRILDGKPHDQVSFNSVYTGREADSKPQVTRDDFLKGVHSELLHKVDDPVQSWEFGG